jgi:hypothetical protein
VPTAGGSTDNPGIVTDGGLGGGSESRLGTPSTAGLASPRGEEPSSRPRRGGIQGYGGRG